MRDYYIPWMLNLLNNPRTTDDQKKLAVLIDAENISPNKIKLILDEIAKYGKANVKRIYGDWTNTKMNTWKESINKYSIHPIQQFTYTTGKNATDSALIIDAMDLLYSANVDSFCIISSDSDYTGLAKRIRESGLDVYGFGEQKTPEAFRQACDQFIYIENLRPFNTITDFNELQKSIELQRDFELIKSAIEDVSDENGWALLSRIGINIRNKKPDFDFRTYGYKKLIDLIRSTELYDIHEDNLKIRLKEQC